MRELRGCIFNSLQALTYNLYTEAAGACLGVSKCSVINLLSSSLDWLGALV